ncbi:MAG: hypothetical protein ACREIC_03225, partial [Limisphaerales bacterium]
SLCWQSSLCRRPLALWATKLGNAEQAQHMTRQLGGRRTIARPEAAPAGRAARPARSGGGVLRARAQVGESN